MEKTYNRRRSGNLSHYKKKNYKLIDQTRAFMKEYKIESIQEELLLKLQKNLQYCAVYSLYSHDMPENDHTYIGSGTCDNKCCFICNWKRQKAIRRKYKNWFNINSFVIQSEKGKFYTIAQAKKNNIHGHPVNYSLMHLVLTVPHYQNGFQGEKYYYKRIMELFNWMRKEKEWLRLVIGGEFGIETEMKSNGLHIHIHSLLLVHDIPQCRNQLHKFILQKWNRLTVNSDNPRTSFTEKDIIGIKKGNPSLDINFIKQLNPQGTTILTLETIYSLQNGEKVRSSTFNDDSMIKALMETISYHFHPHAFDKADGTINIPLLAEILPAVHGRTLYKKFGCLHGEKELNISFKSEPEEEFQEAAAMKVNEETGEILSDRQFFLLNPRHVYHPKNEDYKIHISQRGQQLKRILQVSTATEAVHEMSKLVQNFHTHKKS